MRKYKYDGVALAYHGYQTKIEYDKETKHLYGKILGIHDLNCIEAKTFFIFKRKFKMAVTDYIQICYEINKTPEYPDEWLYPCTVLY